MKYILISPEQVTGGEVVLDGEVFHHVCRVLRLGTGAPLRLADGSGKAYCGTIADLSAKRARVVIDAVENVPAAPGPAIGLIYGLAKAGHTEWVLEKATELGVDEIRLALCVRSVSRPKDGPRKQARWVEIARHAARQAERAWVPRIHPVRPLAEVLAETGDDALKLVATLDGPALQTQEERLRGGPPAIVLLVGPEGGLTAEEISAAAVSGFRPVSLGPQILRTETAAITLLSVVSYLSGRWKTGDILRY